VSRRISCIGAKVLQPLDFILKHMVARRRSLTVGRWVQFKNQHKSFFMIPTPNSHCPKWFVRCPRSRCVNRLSPYRTPRAAVREQITIATWPYLLGCLS
jgi:hypothetical protein